MRMGKKILLKKNHALVPLTQGKFAKIDRQDIKAVGAHSWFYAMDHSRTIIKEMYHVRAIIKGKSVRLHLFLIGKRKRCHVNYKNGDRLDFRRKNLEHVSIKYIHQKKGKISTPTTSIYKGVSFHINSEKWEANIKKNNVRKYLGCFDKEQDAALAYNQAALKCFGEHTFLNKI